MTLPIDLVLIRHGQSEVNAAKRLSDAGNHSAYTEEFRSRHTRSFRLTEQGRHQAEQAGEWLTQEFYTDTSMPFDTFITSEYTRAIETAGMIGLPNARWKRNFYLTERDWGGIEAYTEKERRELFGDALTMRTIEPFFWRAPNGESFTDLCMRVEHALTNIWNHGRHKKAIVVCHGEVMWAARVLLEEMSHQQFKELHLSKDYGDQIWNAQILHYSRRDPRTLRVHNDRIWMRMIRPTEDPIWIAPWKEIFLRTYSNGELLAIAETYPPSLSD